MQQSFWRLITRALPQGKSIEKFENGRTTLNRTKIDEILSAYGQTREIGHSGLTYADFENCRNGKIEQIKKRLGHKQIKVIENNPRRRSYKKFVTKEAKALVVMRRLKDLSQYKASRLCGYSQTAIGHIENGRIEIPRKRIKHIVESYGFTMNDFENHMKSEVFVTDIQDDCISIIKRLSEDKLKAVYPLLSTFKN